MKKSTHEIRDDEKELFFLASSKNEKEFLKDLKPKESNYYLEEEIDGACMFTKEAAEEIMDENPNEYIMVKVGDVLNPDEYEIEEHK